MANVFLLHVLLRAHMESMDMHFDCTVELEKSTSASNLLPGERSMLVASCTQPHLTAATARPWPRHVASPTKPQPRPFTAHSYA